MESWDRNRVEAYKDGAVAKERAENETKLKQQVDLEHMSGNIRASTMTKIALDELKEVALKVIQRDKDAYEENMEKTINDANALVASWKLANYALKTMTKAYAEMLGKTEDNYNDDKIQATIEAVSQKPELIETEKNLSAIEPTTEWINRKLKERGENFKPNLDGVGDDFGKPKSIKTPKIGEDNTEDYPANNPAMALLKIFGERLGMNHAEVLVELHKITASFLSQPTSGTQQNKSSSNAEG